MPGPTSSFRTLLLPSLLVISGVLNAVLLLRSVPEARQRAAKKRATQAPRTPAPTTRVAPPKRPTLRQQLRLCRLQSWRLVMQQARRSRNTAPPPSAPAPDATGYAAQREALCRMGLKQLRHNWVAGRDSITQSLRRDLADPAHTARDVERFAEHLGSTLGLSQAQQRELAQAYGPLREARLTNAVSSLRRDPPDYAAVLDEAFALFEDEDQLVRKRFGGARLAQARASQLESRTAVIAILAALADLPWDKRLKW